MFRHIDSQAYTSGNESSSFPHSTCLTTCHFPLIPQTEELEMTLSAACIKLPSENK